MGGKRWLNIVVDGNIALQPYWQDIVSNYLENIIRSFRGNLLEEAYLGLVMYNANTELVETGYDIQFINWTKDANKFLESLSCLTFKGNNVNQCTMAEGLAEALVMYPKPSDIMPTIDYYNAERHCILIAPSDPHPKRMMLCLPMIQQGNLVGQRLKAREADFLDVSQMFPSLRISLSVITPNSLPIFGAIFSLGNDALLSNVPISSYSNGQLTIMMSKSFQYARNALIQEKRPSTTSVESMNMTIPRVLACNFQANNTPFPACEVSIGERISQTSRTESTSSQPLNFHDFVFPNEASPTDIALASFVNPQMNEFDDIFAPSKRSKTMVTLEEDNLKDLFEPNQEIPSDYINNFTGQERGQGESSTGKMISTEAIKAVENELEQALKDDGSNHTSNVELISSSSKGFYIPAPELQTHTSSAMEEYSTRLLQSVTNNNCTFNPTWSSQNPSSSSASLPQQQPPSLEEEYSARLLHGINSNKSVINPMFCSQNPSTSASLLPQQHHVSVGEEYSTGLLHDITSDKSILNPMLSSQNSSNSNSAALLPQQQYSSSLCPTEPQSLYNQHGLVNNPPQISTNAIGNSSLLQFQPYQPYSSQNQFRYQSNPMASSSALNSSTFGTFNHQRNFLCAPTIDNFRNYILTWEGSLKGKIHHNRRFKIRAKAFRSPTTPLTLTIKWLNKLKIINFIPEKAVNDTKNIYYPIGYVFFHVVQHNHFDLYRYLKSSNLCGKVDLALQSIIIAPTEKENYFLGTVFDRTAVFVEQH